MEPFSKLMFVYQGIPSRSCSDHNFHTSCSLARNPKVSTFPTFVRSNRAPILDSFGYLCESELCGHADYSPRREILTNISLYLLGFGSLFINPATSIADNGQDVACENGAILPEEAIPGAYQNVCMGLSERSVTLQTNGYTITVKQDISSSVTGRTGVVVWNSSLLLLRLLDNIAKSTHGCEGNFFTNKTILEVGCGTGLCSIAVAKLAGHKNSSENEEEFLGINSRFYATDGNEEVVELARLNARLNGLTSDFFRVNQLKWSFLDAMEYSDEVDLVFGSDLTYNANSWPSLAQTASTVLKPESGVFLYLTCGHAGFSLNSELTGFVSVAQSEGLTRLTETDARWPFRDPNTGISISLSSLLQQSLSRADKDVTDLNGGTRILVFVCL